MRTILPLVILVAVAAPARAAKLQGSPQALSCYASAIKSVQALAGAPALAKPLSGFDLGAFSRLDPNNERHQQAFARFARYIDPAFFAKLELYLKGPQRSPEQLAHEAAEPGPLYELLIELKRARGKALGQLIEPSIQEIGKALKGDLALSVARDIHTEIDGLDFLVADSPNLISELGRQILRAKAAEATLELARLRESVEDRELAAALRELDDELMPSAAALERGLALSQAGHADAIASAMSRSLRVDRSQYQRDEQRAGTARLATALAKAAPAGSVPVQKDALLAIRQAPLGWSEKYKEAGIGAIRLLAQGSASHAVKAFAAETLRAWRKENIGWVVTVFDQAIRAVEAIAALKERPEPAALRALERVLGSMGQSAAPRGGLPTVTRAILLSWSAIGAALLGLSAVMAAPPALVFAAIGILFGVMLSLAIALSPSRRGR